MDKISINVREYIVLAYYVLYYLVTLLNSNSIHFLTIKILKGSLRREGRGREDKLCNWKEWLFFSLSPKCKFFLTMFPRHHLFPKQLITKHKREDRSSL